MIHDIKASELEHNLLFDDVALLKTKLGTGYSRVTSVNADCDCSGYTSTPDDEGFNPAEGSGTAA